jgi:hypothetical protein
MEETDICKVFWISDRPWIDLTLSKIKLTKGAACDMDQLLKEFDGHGYDSVPSEPGLPRFCVELANLVSLSKHVEKSTINLQSTLNLANFEDLVNVEALGNKSFALCFLLH